MQRNNVSVSIYFKSSSLPKYQVEIGNGLMVGKSINAERYKMLKSPLSLV